MDVKLVLEHLTRGTLRNGICRVCLEENEILTNIFNEVSINPADTASIVNVLREITSLQINTDDGLPTVICSKCMDEARNAYNFKMKSHRCNQMLTNCLESIYKQITNASFIKNESYESPATILMILPENEIFIIEKDNTPDDSKERIQCLINDVDTEHVESESKKFDDSEVFKNNWLIKSNYDFDSFSIDPNIVQFISDNRDGLLISEIDSDYLYDCTMCYQTFWSKNDLQSHKAMHPNDSRHFCRICNKTYKKSNMLKIHMVKHNGVKEFVCPICRVAFYYQKNLKKHMELHGERIKFSCDYCGKDYKYLLGLEEHIRFEHMGEMPPFMCEECGTLMRSAMTLKLHKKIHNHVKRSNVCKYCKKTYNNERYFKNHIAKHERSLRGYSQKIPSKVFICDYCGKEHNVKEYLKRHIMIEHFNLRNFKCNECGKAFRTSGNLKEHRIVHTRERPEQCDVCGNRFVSKIALKLHQRLHSGERPYTCDVCGDKFLSSSRRMAHLKSKHMEKQEQCPICFRKYYLRTTLNQHMLTHNKPAVAKNRKTSKLDPLLIEIPVVDK